MKSSVFVRSGRGFTLVEIMVVMAVILILAGIGVTSWLGVVRRQDASTAKTQLALISAALESYHSVNHSYPVGEGSNLLYRVLYWDAAQGEGKVFLEKFSGGAWIDGEGEDAKVVDPWGREYGYICLGEKNPEFDLWSAGPDGEADPDNIDAPENRDNVWP
jgi:type II secretion system protein G